MARVLFTPRSSRYQQTFKIHGFTPDTGKVKFKCQNDAEYHEWVSAMDQVLNRDEQADHAARMEELKLWCARRR